MHTPDPWQAVRNQDGSSAILAHGEQIGTITDPKNVSMVLLAPEMYELLREISQKWPGDISDRANRLVRQADGSLCR